MFSREAIVTWTLRVLAPLFVVLAITGAVRNYTQVPHWDMWPSYLDFYLRIGEGHWGDWWALHNEHRIVLARILFWLDLRLFSGTLAFLLVMNYLLVFAAFLTFRAILRERAGAAANGKLVTLASLFVLACLFSWMQKENLTWGFQSQFFLAQWLPLLALWLLYRATLPAPEAGRDFVLACVVGVLCIMTMASGVIALPLMLAYAALLRMGWRRVAVLALLAAVCLAAYFSDYQSTPGHGSLRDVLRYRPEKLVQYVLLYLGSPWFHAFKQRSLPLGQVAGLVLVVLASVQAVRCLRAPREHALQLCLLAFIMYIGGTAFGTGAGRLVFGLRQATAERYTTPALMAWMALLALYLPTLLRQLAAWRHRIVWPMLALLAALLVVQLDARRSQRHVLFERDVAAVAIELGVLDSEQLIRIIFSPELGVYYGARAGPADLGVFGRSWLKDAGPMIGRPAGPLPAAACQGALLQTEVLPDDRGFRRIVGWIAPAAGDNNIHALRVVDAAGDVVGYALAGERMKTPNPARGNVPDTRYFKGYVLSRAAHGALGAASADAGCTLRMVGEPAPPFDFIPSAMSLGKVNVTPSAVLRNEGWHGTDYQRSTVPGYRALGSFVQGDQDTGTLVLRLKRGATFVYRTGPAAGRQRFQVDDGRQFAGTLPKSERWSAVVFDNPLLPDAFTLTLTDGGTGWGEWSAIGILDKP